MSDSTQEAMELLSLWTEQRTTVNFLIRRLELSPSGIVGGEARGTGNIIKLQDGLFRLERQDGNEVKISIDGEFIVEYSLDRTFLIVRSPDHRVSVELKPHSGASEG